MLPVALNSGFNPRPPILAGDAHPGIRHWRRLHVSIHARQYWRAMRGGGGAINSAVGAFQSTPANTGGRCLTGAVLANSDASVSIHARQYWRAMHVIGRRAIAFGACFNPRPPILAGDASAARVPASAPAGFNPRPPILAGDAGADNGAQHHGLVSIHARQYWRAMQHGQRRLARLQRFQSTPANTGGRCLGGVGDGGDGLRRFNPRPPILAGDASLAFGQRFFFVVSIHARQYWRAMRSHGDQPPRMVVFQSTPANTGGRCHDAQLLNLVIAHVSIHARQYWRAMRHGLPVAGELFAFQSTPANTGGRCPARAARR